ncbi:3-oxoadipate CoA-transferase subunit B [Brevundimonas sp. NIBR10]|uniref:3-oxoacid CoA-transferase subunit B n=1 Tax=Brevundimonas sp. NIBR10 TaxID=3015997 RepID=UPI0022F176D8|nr:3-oxoacid CoA-transferase subunit B [Brevundimonas sp. NIBR10]WGM45933.1 3-oxoadipate CoA-transferase subunit B [Brevundimonas sp. NIBR10]
MATGWTLNQTAALAARDIPDGAYVNLGIGRPECVADVLPGGIEIVLHSENGILGMGPRPAAGTDDRDLINAGKKSVSLLAGGSYFHHADSFGMIRGGHLDICIMGAFEVSASGDLANWSTGQGGVPGVGGAMDLALGARSVRIICTHLTHDGRPKLVDALTMPATGRGIVHRIYTDLAVLDPAGEAFIVRKMAPGVDAAALAAVTGAPLVFHVSPVTDPLTLPLRN